MKVLPRIIDPKQSVFLEGRNILHSMLIANEAVEKAYDLVSWNFYYSCSRNLVLERNGLDGANIA